MTDFAEHFREHVQPKLVAEIDRQSFFLACDMTDWHDAFYSVMTVAHRYGALHLPEATFHDLRDAIGSALLRRMEAQESRLDQEPEDPVTHYEDLASSCAQPDAMRWVFASISKEYRDSLIASTRPARAEGVGG